MAIAAKERSAPFSIYYLILWYASEVGSKKFGSSEKSFSESIESKELSESLWSEALGEPTLVESDSWPFCTWYFLFRLSNNIFFMSTFTLPRLQSGTGPVFTLLDRLILMLLLEGTTVELLIFGRLIQESYDTLCLSLFITLLVLWLRLILCEVADDSA